MNKKNESKEEKAGGAFFCTLQKIGGIIFRSSDARSFPYEKLDKFELGIIREIIKKYAPASISCINLSDQQIQAVWKETPAKKLSNITLGSSKKFYFAILEIHRLNLLDDIEKKIWNAIFPALESLVADMDYSNFAATTEKEGKPSMENQTQNHKEKAENYPETEQIQNDSGNQLQGIGKPDSLNAEILSNEMTADSPDQIHSGIAEDKNAESVQDSHLPNERETNSGVTKQSWKNGALESPDSRDDSIDKNRNVASVPEISLSDDKSSYTEPAVVKEDAKSADMEKDMNAEPVQDTSFSYDDKALHTESAVSREIPKSTKSKPDSGGETVEAESVSALSFLSGNEQQVPKSENSVNTQIDSGISEDRNAASVQDISSQNENEQLQTDPAELKDTPEFENTADDSTGQADSVLSENGNTASVPDSSAPSETLYTRPAVIKDSKESAIGSVDQDKEIKYEKAVSLPENDKSLQTEPVVSKEEPESVSDTQSQHEMKPLQSASTESRKVEESPKISESSAGQTESDIPKDDNLTEPPLEPLPQTNKDDSAGAINPDIAEDKQPESPPEPLQQTDKIDDSAGQTGADIAKDKPPEPPTDTPLPEKDKDTGGSAGQIGADITKDNLSEPPTEPLPEKDKKEFPKPEPKILLKKPPKPDYGQHYALSNAKAGEFYREKLDFAKIVEGGREKIIDYSISFGDYGKDDDALQNILGLTLDKENDEIRGTPLKAGNPAENFEFALTLRYKTDSGDDDFEKEQAKKTIFLKVLPDPKAMWKEIEPPEDLPYRKEHTAKGMIPAAGGGKLLWASKRGRSHAHKGKFRDDHVKAVYMEETGWSVIAVADGAGFAQFSREGSRIACEKSVEMLSDFLIKKNAQLEEAIEKAYTEGAGDQEKSLLKKMLDEIMISSAYAAVKAIHEEAAKENRKVKEYSTTLLLAVHKCFALGNFFAGFWIGDGTLAVYTKNTAEQKGNVRLMGTPDGGEFSGQTHFLTENSIWKNPDELRQRTQFFLEKDFTALFAATDGISDAKFITEKNLSDLSFWDRLWADLEENISPYRENSEDRLLKWLDFWAEGEHDDRTIAMLI